MAFVGCWWLYMRLALQFNWVDESFSLTTGFILNCLLKLWIAVEAGQRFAEGDPTVPIVTVSAARSGETAITAATKSPSAA